MFSNSLVFVNGDGQIFTSSLKVAEVFEKEHCHVLRDIENLTASIDKDFGQSNFGLTSYTDSANRQQPAYNLTRDGFSLLVMGFTGEKAHTLRLAA